MCVVLAHCARHGIALSTQSHPAHESASGTRSDCEWCQLTYIRQGYHEYNQDRQFQSYYVHPVTTAPGLTAHNGRRVLQHIACVSTSQQIAARDGPSFAQLDDDRGTGVIPY
jgi:hypothetical protein